MYDKDVKEQSCLACKFFRLIDVTSGVCKEDKSVRPDYPVKKSEDSCPKWHDAGQQYHIRLGWLKNKKNELKDSE